VGERRARPQVIIVIPVPNVLNAHLIIVKLKANISNGTTENETVNEAQ